MRKQRGLLCLCMIFILLLTGCKKELRASEYVQANLDLIFQGETQQAQEFVTASKDDLEQVYQNGIYAFVENYLTEGVDEDNTYTSYYAYLVEEIFRTMRYQVEDAEEIDGDTYQVEVHYQPVNIFPNFVEEVQELSEELEERMENGYYTGTEEEQQQLMLTDYMESAYILLGEAYLNMKYGEEESYTFSVTRGAQDVPELGEKEINEFMGYILALDKL